MYLSGEILMLAAPPKSAKQRLLISTSNVKSGSFLELVDGWDY